MTGRLNARYVQVDLFLGVFYRVRAVADVTANSKSKVATDGTYEINNIRQLIR